MSTIVNNHAIRTLINKSIEGDTYEFEVRFAFLANLTGRTVQSGISNNVYNQVLYSMGSNKKLTKITTKSNGEYREIFKEDGTQEYMVKFKIKAIDIEDGTDMIRFSLSNEVTCEKKSIEIKNTRIKSRYSHHIKMWRVDLTEVNGFGHELEIELDKVSVKSGSYTMTDILETLDVIINKYRSFIFIDNRLRSLLDIDLHSNLSSVLNIVITLDRSALISVLNNKYSITEKADGLRCLLFIVNDKLHIITAKFNIIKTIPIDKSLSINDTIIEAEFINEKLVLAFDLLAFKSTKTINSSFYKRYRHMVKVVSSLSSLSSVIEIRYKKFYCDRMIDEYLPIIKTDNIFSKSMDLFKDKYEYKLDGIIFTPIDSSYVDKKIKLFKWKDIHTVDLQVNINSSTSKISLFSYDRKRGLVNVDELTYDDTLITEEKRKINDGDIIEFSVLYNEKFILKPLKHRLDKIKPNSYDAIINILIAVRDNLTIDVMRSLTYDAIKEFKISSSLFIHDTIRRISSSISKELISIDVKFKSRSDSIICINTTINDNLKAIIDSYGIVLLINKYMKNVLKFDEWIRQNIKTAADAYIKCIQSNFYEIDEIKESLYLTMFKSFLKKTSTVNKILSINDIHHAMESKDIFNIYINMVLKYLKPGGIFCGSFIDGKSALNETIIKRQSDMVEWTIGDKSVFGMQILNYKEDSPMLKICYGNWMECINLPFVYKETINDMVSEVSNKKLIPLTGYPIKYNDTTELAFEFNYIFAFRLIK